MNAPAQLFSGRVMHVRHTRPRTRFAYRIWMLAVDIDRIDQIARASRLFRHNRRALVALRDRDHAARDGSPLRGWVSEQLRMAGLERYAARIHFMTMPRLLGYAFNPISFYFCYDEGGVLGAMVHQVKNTFGHQHGYVLPVTPDEAMRQTARKRMHVSPFFDLQGGYRFACSAPDFAQPGSTFALSIRYGTEAEPRMTAVMKLRGEAFSDRALLRLLGAMPLMTIKVTAAIHWHALKLWLRGARYHPVPTPPGEPASLGVHA